MKTKKILSISLCFGLLSSISVPNIVLPADGSNGDFEVLPEDPSIQ